jgi:transcriptional regulator with XRE-family HTH domain
LDDTTAIRLSESFRIKLFERILSKYIQKDLAKKINTSERNIIEWKYGRFGIDNRFLKRLLELSNLKEKDLLNSIETTNKNIYIFNKN